MEHLLLKAATTAATDEGTFTAVISAASIDREKDIVDPAGMVRALQKWAQLGKNIPLAWNHSSAPEDQIGYIVPGSAKAVNGEVVVSGYIDQSTSVGADAWRMVKMGTLGFSFGYLIPEGGATPRKGGGRHIKEVDVFEITATPAPMNGDTRVLGWKSLAELRKHAEQVQREVEEGQVKAVADATASEDDDATEDPEQALRDAIEELQEFISGEHDEGDSADVATARRFVEGLRTLLRGEMAEPEKAIDPTAQDRKAHRFERDENDRNLPEVKDVEPEYATLHITFEEMDGLAAGDLKAVWSAAFINNLPDSSFLYVESGGSKDSDGKTTPRSLRHFPYKDANGSVDLPHLRNALARIPQSNLPASVKESLTAKAQAILDKQKSAVDATGKETKSRSVDPLRRLADTVALEYASDGESRKKPPAQKTAPKPEPEFELRELRRRMREETLIALSGVEQP